MKLKAIFSTVAMAGMLLFSTASQAAPALDDPSTVLTVMQFTLKPGASREELLNRMTAIRDYGRKQPGIIDNAIMENRNTANSPTFVGVTRWKSFKAWEAMWTSDEFKKLVARVTEIGDINPGTFAPVPAKTK
ncbi:MAG: antibiotic biosynthesis monooxygenase [Pseudomonadota bacterium]|jgi:heme-degrading monooxygenase HmoA